MLSVKQGGIKCHFLSLCSHAKLVIVIQNITQINKSKHGIQGEGVLEEENKERIIGMKEESEKRKVTKW